MDWWNQWNSYVNFVNQTEIISKKTKQMSLDSSDSAGSGNVIATGYNQLDSMTENHGLRPPGGHNGEIENSFSPMSSPRGSRKSNVLHRPGSIDNSTLIVQPSHKIASLTGEGGRLKPSLKLIRGKDFELIPERLWKALIEWYVHSNASWAHIFEYILKQGVFFERYEPKQHN